jgi:hypothetical protein
MSSGAKPPLVGINHTILFEANVSEEGSLSSESIFFFVP